MTKITFFKHGDVYYGFRETGHAGFADFGSDILCAAISSMTMLLVNTVEVSYDSNIEYSIDEENADITVLAKAALPDCEPDEKKQYAVSGLIYGFYLQLTDMLEDYHDFLEVLVTDDESAT